MSDDADNPANQPQADKPGEKGSQEFTPAVAFAMGEIKGTVENLRTDLKEWKDDLRSTIAAGDATAIKKADDIENRVRVLEKWMWKTSAVISFVVAAVTWALEHYLK